MLIGNNADLADISVLLTGNLSVAIPNETLKFLITVSNAGPSVAKNVKFDKLDLPVIENIEYSFDNGITYNATLINIDKLNAGEAITVIAKGTVIASATSTMKNTVKVVSDTHDPDVDNNIYTYEVKVRTNAVLSLEAVVEPFPAHTDSDVIYRLTISNFGPSDANDVILNDIFPPELTDRRYSLDNINQLPWNGPLILGSIKANADKKVSLFATVSPASEIINNNITVASTTPNLYPHYNKKKLSTPVNHAADLAIQKTTVSNPIRTGDYLFYGITVSNDGPDSATNTVITDTSPVQLENMEFSADGGNTWKTWIGTYNVGDIGIDSSFTLLLRGIVNIATGSIMNTAKAICDMPDPNLHNNESTSFVAINKDANLILEQTVSCNKIYAGNQVEYNFTIRNLGPNTANNVQLSDNISIVDDILNPEFSIQGSNIYTPWSNPYTIDKMNVSDTFILKLRGMVKPSTTTKNIGNSASVTSDAAGNINPSFSMTSASFNVSTSADVAVTIKPNGSPVLGKDFSYDVTVTNLGPSDAQDVTIIDVLPTVIENPKFSLDGGTTFNTWINPYKIGVLAANTNVKLTLKGTVNSITTGEFVNSVTVHSTTLDPNICNNTAKFSSNIQSSADISVVKTANTDAVYSNGEIQYSVTILNIGPNLARKVVLTDKLPDELYNVRISTDDGKSWIAFNGDIDIGDLKISEKINLLINADVKPDSAYIQNTVFVNSLTPDPDFSNNSSTVLTPINATADISVVKTANTDAVYSNGEIQYSVTISNGGPNLARKVVLTDKLPDELYNVRISTDDGKSWIAFNGNIDIGDLKISEKINLLIKADVKPDSAYIQNTVFVNSLTPDPDFSNNSSTVLTPINAIADISVVTNVNKQIADNCERIFFTMLISNSGPQTAEDVVLTDCMPKSLINADYSLDNGKTHMFWDGELRLGDLKKDENIIVLISATINQDDVSIIQNIVSVRTRTTDPNIKNNTDSDIIVIRDYC